MDNDPKTRLTNNLTNNLMDDPIGGGSTEPDRALSPEETEDRSQPEASQSLRMHHWTWRGKPITVAYEVMGQGTPIVLLPALSTVSSREEMRRLAELLSQRYQVFVMDWVGFGDSARPALAYTPKLLEACLRNFIQSLFQEPVVVIAAGHAAGYVMKLLHQPPAPWRWIVLVCPTWRGPLPTAMGEHRWVYRLLQGLVNLPIVGSGLYALNIQSRWLAAMYRRHVFADPQHVTQELMRSKQRTARRKGARFGSAAFVTGALDGVRNRQDWIGLFQPAGVPVMMVIGEDMPPKSRQEVEVIAHFCGVQVHRMPGSLGLHEEYPEQLAHGIMPFLDKYLSRKKPS